MKEQINMLNKQIQSIEEAIKTKYGEEIKKVKQDENFIKIKIERENE